MVQRQRNNKSARDRSRTPPSRYRDRGDGDRGRGRGGNNDGRNGGGRGRGSDNNRNDNRNGGGRGRGGHPNDNRNNNNNSNRRDGGRQQQQPKGRRTPPPPSPPPTTEHHYDIRKALAKCLENEEFVALAKSKEIDIPINTILEEVCVASDKLCFATPPENGTVDQKTLEDATKAVVAATTSDTEVPAKLATLYAEAAVNILKPCKVPQKVKESRGEELPRKGKRTEQPIFGNNAGLQRFGGGDGGSSGLLSPPSILGAPGVLSQQQPRMNNFRQQQQQQFAPQAVPYAVPVAMQPSAAPEGRSTRCVTFSNLPAEMTADHIEKGLRPCMDITRNIAFLRVLAAPEDKKVFVSFTNEITAKMCAASPDWPMQLGFPGIRVALATEEEETQFTEEGLKKVEEIETEVKAQFTAIEEFSIEKVKIEAELIMVDDAEVDAALAELAKEETPDLQKKKELLVKKLGLREKKSALEATCVSNGHVSLAAVLELEKDPEQSFSSSSATIENALHLLFIRGFDKPMPDRKVLALLKPLKGIVKHIWRHPVQHDLCIEYGSIMDVLNALRVTDAAGFKYLDYTLTRE